MYTSMKITLSVAFRVRKTAIVKMLNILIRKFYLGRMRNEKE